MLFIEVKTDDDNMRSTDVRLSNISMFIQLVVKLINVCVKWHYNFNENIQLILQIHHYEIYFNFHVPFHYLECQPFLQISFE